VNWTPISARPEADLSYYGGVRERCISSGSSNQGFGGLFSVGDLSRMDVVLLVDLLNGFDAVELLQAHAGFELGIVLF
jgi:hypothetical protein